MAGTLTISTLSDGTNSTSATNPIRGSARAWVNYNGVAQTIGTSFNVSSVTYNGTGDYTVNFTTAMANTTYAVVQASKPNTADSLSMNNYNILSTSAVNVFYVIPTVGSRNVLSASVAVFSS